MPAIGNGRGFEHRTKNPEVIGKFFSKVLKISRLFRFGGHCILKKALFRDQHHHLARLFWPHQVRPFQHRYSDAKAFSVTQPKSVRACLDGTEGSMLSKWYGEFEWDNFTVKFYSHRGQKTGVVIEYGKNLTALEQDEDNSGVYTALLPYAVYTSEGADTETVVTLPEMTLPICLTPRRPSAGRSILPSSTMCRMAQSSSVPTTVWRRYCMTR